MSSNQLSKDLASLRIKRDAPRSSRAWGKYVLVLALLGGGAAAYVYGRPMVEARLFKKEVAVTEIWTISPSQAAVDVTSTGYVIPQLVAKVGSNVVGRVTKVNVREGQTVNAGDTLFEIDHVTLDTALATAKARLTASYARVRAAKAAVSEASVPWARQKKLVESGSGLAAQVEDLGARVASLAEQAKASEAEAVAVQAEVKAIEDQLLEYTIKSPIRGVAQNKPVSIGDVVGPSFPLVELVEPESLLVETDVAEGRLHLIKNGGPCGIILDATPGKRYRGSVVEVSPRMNRAKATAVVKVKLEDKPDRLAPDMAARVSFLTKALDEATLKEQPKTVVPANAIVDRGGAKAVFVLEDGKVRLTNVVVGAEMNEGFELLEGPPPGTRVIQDPPANLSDGQAVKEKEKSS